MMPLMDKKKLPSSAEIFFLTCLFNKLNSSGIHYAVMRNHETLPYSAGGSDLDIIVRSQDEFRTKEAIQDSIQKAGGICLGLSETIGFFKIYAFGCNPETPSTWWGQCIDVNVGLFYKGQRQMNDCQPWPVHNYRSIVVLKDGFAGVLGVLKEALNNGTFPERYALAARQAIEQDWVTIKTLLAPMGDTSIKKLKAIILTDATTDARALICRQLRKDFLRHTFTNRTGIFFRGIVANEMSKIRRYIKPSGKVITILGVDGAGKSTIINAIKPVLDHATHNATVVQHLRPTWLPPLARFKGKKEVATGPVLDPHGSKPSGFLGSLFRLIYLTLDYILGYWIKIRTKIAKQPTVVIFDRYAYDIALDPQRFRIKLPVSLIRWFTRLAPKPDIIFCLHGNPEVIAARKMELPIDEVTRQVEALKAFAANEPRAILISTEGKIEEARDQVLQAISDYCAINAGK